MKCSYCGKDIQAGDESTTRWDVMSVPCLVGIPLPLSEEWRPFFVTSREAFDVTSYVVWLRKKQWQHADCTYMDKEDESNKTKVSTVGQRAILAQES